MKYICYELIKRTSKILIEIIRLFLKYNAFNLKWKTKLEITYHNEV